MKTGLTLLGGIIIGAIIYTRGASKLIAQKERKYKKNLKYVLKDMKVPNHKIAEKINRVFEV